MAGLPTETRPHRRGRLAARRAAIGPRTTALNPSAFNLHPQPSTLDSQPDPARTRWQRLRIEFEHRSRNFRDHHHDPAACDLIVCWHHDWPECPLEVLELAEAVRSLKAEK